MKKYSDGISGYGTDTYGPRRVSWCPPAQAETTFVEQSALAPSWREQGIVESPFVETTDNTMPYTPCEDE